MTSPWLHSTELLGALWASAIASEKSGMPDPSSSASASVTRMSRPSFFASGSTDCKHRTYGLE